LNKAIIDRITRLIEEGSNAESDWVIQLWTRKVYSFLEEALGATEASGFARLSSADLREQRLLQLGYLKFVAASAEGQGM